MDAEIILMGSEMLRQRITWFEEVTREYNKDMERLSKMEDAQKVIEIEEKQYKEHLQKDFTCVTKFVEFIESKLAYLSDTYGDAFFIQLKLLEENDMIGNEDIERFNDRCFTLRDGICTSLGVQDVTNFEEVKTWVQKVGLSADKIIQLEKYYPVTLSSSDFINILRNM
jgi:hypothetical protein